MRFNVESESEAAAHAQNRHRQLQSQGFVGHQLRAFTQRQQNCLVIHKQGNRCVRALARVYHNSVILIKVKITKNVSLTMFLKHYTIHSEAVALFENNSYSSNL